MKLQKELSELVDEFIETHYDVNNESCSSAVLDLLGGDSNMAPDDVYEMKHSFFELLAFMAKPEINKKFDEEVVKENCYAKEYATHIKRMLWFLERIDNPLAYAEMQKHELKSYGIDDDVMLRWKKDYKLILDQNRK